MERSSTCMGRTVPTWRGRVEQEIEMLVPYRRALSEEDRKQFELVEAKNKASQQVYQLEKLMKENDEKLSDSDKEPMNKAIEKVKEAANGDDVDAIKQASDELDAASQAFSKILYEQAEAAGGDGQADADGNADGDDDAIDADFEVKN